MNRFVNKIISLILVGTFLFGVIPYKGFIISEATSAEGVFINEVNSVSVVPSGYTGIYTAADMNSVRNSLSGKFILMNDIDLSAFNWTPIGTEKKPFAGSFDGNGHIIRNLYVSKTVTAEYYAGLFGFVSGSLTNIKVENARIDITSSHQLSVGIIAGRSSTITNCSAQGQINVKSTSVVEKNSKCVYDCAVGGVVGLKYASTATKNCTSNTQIKVDSVGVCAVGGIVGGEELWYEMSVSDCVSNGNIYVESESNAYVGGVVGACKGNFLSSCINNSNISVVSDGTADTNSVHVGGIIGQSYYLQNDAEYRYSANLGVISVDCKFSSNVYLGGIVGSSQHYLGNTIIEECYNMRTLSVNGNNTSYAQIGGIAGSIYSQGSEIIRVKNCFNSGSLVAQNLNSAKVSGIAGSATINWRMHFNQCYNVGKHIVNGCQNATEYHIVHRKDSDWNGSTFTGSYYLNIVSGLATGEGKSLTHEQMKQGSGFSGYDFNSVWTFSNGLYPYPVLRNTFSDNIVLTDWETDLLSKNKSNPPIDVFGKFSEFQHKYDFEIKVMGIQNGTAGTDNVKYLPVEGAEVNIFIGDDVIASVKTNSEGVAYFDRFDFTDLTYNLEYLMLYATVSARKDMGQELYLYSDVVYEDGSWLKIPLCNAVSEPLVVDEPRWYVPTLKVLIDDGHVSECEDVLKNFSSLFAQSTNGHIIINNFEIISIPEFYYPVLNDKFTKEMYINIAQNNNIDICMTYHHESGAWAGVNFDEDNIGSLNCAEGGYWHEGNIIWCPINNDDCSKTLCHEMGHYLLGFIDEYASAIGYDSYLNGLYTIPENRDDFSKYYSYDIDGNGRLEDEDDNQDNLYNIEEYEQYGAYWRDPNSKKWGVIPRPNNSPPNFGLMENQHNDIELSTENIYNKIEMQSVSDQTLQYYISSASCEKKLAYELLSLSDKQFDINYSYAENTQTASYFFAGGKNVNFSYTVLPENSTSNYGAVNYTAFESAQKVFVGNEIEFDFNGSDFIVTALSDADVMISDLYGNIVYESSLNEENNYTCSFNVEKESLCVLSIYSYIDDKIIGYSVQRTSTYDDLDLGNEKHTINLKSTSENEAIIVSNYLEIINGEYHSLTNSYFVSVQNEEDICGYLETSVGFNLPIDYSSMTWFLKTENEWVAIDTKVLFDDHGNPMASCKYAGDGTYCLMAKSASSTVYSVPTDLVASNIDTIYDNEVKITFSDTNENIMYYNVYYGIEAITTENYAGMDSKIVDASSKETNIILDDSITDYYFAIQAVGNDGGKSEISESVSCKGAIIDSDSDGLPDYWVNMYSSLSVLENIAGIDNDNDGLTNLEEYENGTNPLNPDTDGDNVYDCLEIWNKLDPLNPMTDGVTDDYVVVYGTPEVGIDESSFVTDGEKVTCTIQNYSDGNAMRTKVYLYINDEIADSRIVNLKANTSVKYTFSNDYLVEGMRIVIDEEKVTRDSDYSNNEFTYVPVSGVASDKADVIITKGTSVQLEYSLTPENATDVLLWETSDSKIVTISNRGIATAETIGTTTVTATTPTGYSYTYNILVEPFPGAGKTDFDCVLINDSTELEIIGYYGNDINIVVPEMIGGYPVTSIANGAFNGCVFENITIGLQVAEIGESAFDKATNMKSIEVPEGNQSFKTDSGVLYNKIMTQLIHYPNAKEDTEFTLPKTVTTIGKNAFAGVTLLNTVNIPESVVAINAKAFYDSNVKNINYAGSQRLWNEGVTKASDSEVENLTISFGKFTATFIKEGEVISQTDYQPGKKIIPPEDPELKYYDFAGWSPEVPETMPETDSEFTAMWTLSDATRTVGYYADGVLYWSDYRYEGELINIPETVPTKVGYTFVEWAPEVAEVMPDENLIYNAVFTPNIHQVTFTADGATHYSYDCAYGESLLLPDTEPVKEGYRFTGWLDVPDLMPNTDVEIVAVFEPIVYTATFTCDGEIIGTDEFTVEDSALDYPVIEEKAGYEWVWTEHKITAGDLTVNGEYVLITYTATFMADGRIIKEVNFDVTNQEVSAPDIPHKDGYTYVWEEYEVTLSDITINAVYTPIVYTATFLADGEIVGTDEFTVEDKSLDYPQIETKEHYQWVWSEHKIVPENLTISGRYNPIIYVATFVADGKIVEEVNFSVEHQDIDEPEVPEKYGYKGVWEDYEAVLSDFTVNAVYSELVIYTATFTHNGKIIGTDTFTVEDESLDYPKIAYKQHYEWKWEDHSIIANNIVVDGGYVPIIYTVKFDSNGTTVKTQTFTVETVDTISAPSLSLPSKVGYYSEWESWNGKICDLTINEIYIPIKYTANFWYNGNLIRTSTFTVENQKSDFTMPSLSERSGYKVIWSDFDIVANDIDIYAEYVPITYTATFVADGKILSTQNFTVESNGLNVPELPQKAGYIASWSYYTISAGDKVITARYYLPDVNLVSRQTLTSGDTYRLMPICNFTPTGKVWTSSDTSVATVDNTGVVTAVGDGKCTITLTCYGKDSLGNEIQATTDTRIIVNGEKDNSAKTFREMFDEFFEVALHDILYNFKAFLIVLFKYAY